MTARFSKGIRPILKQLRTLAGSPFFFAAKNRISRKFKKVAEVSKVQLKIQNNSGKIEKFRGKFKLSAELRRFRRKFETSAEVSKIPLKN